MRCYNKIIDSFNEKLKIKDFPISRTSFKNRFKEKKSQLYS